MRNLPPEEIKELVTKIALTPLGSSVAAAIVCCVIYGLFVFLAFYSFFATKYSWYDILIISASFRTVALGCRAAYLSHYAPGIQGTFLAFYNAGFAASGAVAWVTYGAWMKHKGFKIFSDRGEKIARICCYLGVIPIIAFGPILGVVSAGLEFGAWRTAPHAAFLGERCRRATTYGVLGIFILLTCWGILLNTKAWLVLRRLDKTEIYRNGRNPYLIWLLPVTAIFNLIRGCAGVAALYPTKEYVWANDNFFYPLNVLPDFIVLTILCWPKLLARLSCAYPPQEKPADKEAKGEVKQRRSEK